MADAAPSFQLSNRGSNRGTNRRKRRKGRRGCGSRIFALLSLLALLSGWAWWQSTPPSTSRRPVTVAIPARSGSAAIADRLQRSGLIRNAFVFLWYARIHGDAGRLKAGVYRLSPSMTVGEIIARLKGGGADADDKTVTIPEGWTVIQIAGALASKGIVRDSQSFLSIIKRPNSVKDSPLKAPFPLPDTGLEGYLFPDTYRFAPSTPPAKVAQAMLDRFTAAFFDKHRADIERSGHSLHELVTIASLIEREAEVERDRARIAGVIENRLNRNMKLDIDATVLYALGHHKDRVLYKDLQVASPYNTYRHKGLPPGPIASPGLPSLEAALSPEQHDFLFYVASPDGSHVFTRTEAEHNAAVARMRNLQKRQ